MRESKSGGLLIEISGGIEKLDIVKKKVKE